MIKKINFPLLAILLLALVLRIFALLKYGDFWWDEIFSVTYSQKPWLESIKFWTWETNPFFHMLVLKIWFYFFSPNEITARFPSIIFGVAGVWSLFRFGLIFFNRRIAYTAAFLLALAPYHIFMSCTARGYALLTLLAIINVHYFLLLFYRQEKNRKNIIIFAVSLLALLFTHLTAAWVILAEIIIMLTAGKKYIVEYVKYSIIPFALWLIWAIPSVYF
ncbi:glycosyltransferase family 39 protein, partial [Patescibacteria group bacterium]|nr:glycosyltransferase family 39 protein [Patescibacteria group bacterium]